MADLYYKIKEKSSQMTSVKGCKIYQVVDSTGRCYLTTDQKLVAQKLLADLVAAARGVIAVNAVAGNEI